MSIGALLEKRLAPLLSRSYVQEIKGADGRIYRALSLEFVEDLVRALSAPSHDEIEKPIVINNTTNGPAIVINNTGDVRHEGIWIIDAGSTSNGQQVNLGIGLGSRNIVANELIPVLSAIIDETVARQNLANAAGHGGERTLTPGAKSPVPGAYAGIGHVGEYNPDTVSVGLGGAVGAQVEATGTSGGRSGSGYGQNKSGSGVPFDYDGSVLNATFSAARMLLKGHADVQPRFLGKPTGNISKGNTGTVERWTGTKGSEVASGQKFKPVLARRAAVTTADFVYVDSIDGGYECVLAD